MDLTKVFIAKDGNIVVNVPYLELYIPMAYFNKSGHLAEDNGETIRCVAALPVGLFDDNGKFLEYRTLKVSETKDIYVYDSDVEMRRIPGNPDEISVKVLKYYKGQGLMTDFIVQDSANVQNFLDLILKGKLPSTLRYDHAMMLWNQNLQINNVNLNIPATNRELMYSVLYRDNKQPTRTFAERLNTDPTATLYDYVMVNNRQICQFTSTFTALTFEDFDSMVTSSLRRTKEHLPEPESPLEKIIKM